MAGVQISHTAVGRESGTFWTSQSCVAERTGVPPLKPSLEAIDVELMAAGQIADAIPFLKGAETDGTGGSFQRIAVAVAVIVIGSMANAVLTAVAAFL